MKQATHLRKGKNITNLGTKKVDTYKTINQAKKASHRIQMDADKALGRGSVRAERLAPEKRQPIDLSKKQLSRLRRGV
jgi:hypothetical protein